MLVSWGVSTLRAVFLKAQVSKDSYPLDPSALGIGSLLPTGTANQGSHPEPACWERCISLKIKRAHKPLI